VDVAGIVEGAGVAAAGPGAEVADVLRRLILPAAALGLAAAGVIARLTRTAMLDELSAEYIRLARAMGLPEGEVRYRHAFKAGLARVIPVIGLQAGFVLGGAVYIETVFQWPGLGKLLVDAIAERDLLLVQGGVVVVATCYVLINLATDIVQRLVDPRIEA
jgi:peptide/nickel transport system permease protein